MQGQQGSVYKSVGQCTGGPAGQREMESSSEVYSGLSRQFTGVSREVYRGSAGQKMRGQQGSVQESVGQFTGGQ
ncbi:unnamed protein product [Staurois parvus]|uniref:Uncharacterized protein n=1 Tax=Staurois parvus TaxID=386267 RepID=A0ABN9GLU9_9NEOB|nr:unnamed protein product [Staurois parvus]